MAGPQLADIFWGEIAACCFDCHLTTINDFENFGGGQLPGCPLLVAGLEYGVG